MSRYYIYDTYTDSVAEFARKKKDDKRETKLNRRGMALAGGAALGGAALGGTAGLYQLGAGSTRKYNPATGVETRTLSPVARRQRANVQAMRDTFGELRNAKTGKDRMQAVRDIGSNARNMGREINRGVSVGASRVKYGVGNATRGTRQRIGNAASGLGKSLSNAKLGQKAFGTTRNGRIARGVGAAALAGAAGVAGYRAKRKRDQERSSIKGRVKSLLGR